MGQIADPHFTIQIVCVGQLCSRVQREQRGLTIQLDLAISLNAVAAHVQLNIVNTFQQSDVLLTVNSTLPASWRCPVF